MHAIAVLWMGIGPEQIEKNVIIIRLRCLRALPTVCEVAQLG